MVEVRDTSGEQTIYLSPVSHMTTAYHAANALWQSVHEAAKIHGGRALMRTPDDGEFGFVVFWDKGPAQWADSYAVDPDSVAPGFTVEAEEGTKIRFTDLD